MKNNTKKLLSLFLAVLMMASMNITAFAAEGDFTDDTMSNNNMGAYYYIYHEKDYTDFSGVYLTWSVPIVQYTKTDIRTWNTETLKWEQSDSESTVGTDVTFTLTNRGSYAVKASASFTPVVTDSASVDFGTTNNPTLATIVNSDETRTLKETDTTKQADYLTNNCSATISGTVSLDASKLSATSGKLGTYTVTISKPEN